ncbi:UDP-2-acetamido-2,6-beta-L-arabino-hexul-4-ose reductase [Planctobacterium marinum]|uniref:UDP-2-acetamido-2,6-dideoxy-beta-L-talose 4-dehydrogenase n=1 Tax=Planctobacterium marinum TaxID=1631968 RepID=A0AA48KTL5_9ALTE|nr:UDP-2-acetamido-2,6-dideoxy-beta-L-talose 4-dehydrogenase [Planctobacterium marinum]
MNKNVLITGADGFIGKNLCVSLEKMGTVNLQRFCRGDSLKELPMLVQNADFIFHLAGVNRPKDDTEFYVGNSDLTEILCKAVQACGKTIPIVFSSSTQVERNNPYGLSKLKAETHLLNLYMESGNPIYIYRLPNVFGKWSKPNYNSVVATFCHNISHDIPIEIHNPATKLNLVHIGAVITSFLSVLSNQPQNQLYVNVEPVYETSLGELAETIKSFKQARETLIIPQVGESFLRVLYATYVSYISPSSFSYSLKKHADPRGVFVEMLKTKDSGQFSYFTALPGVTRGGHYHHVKTEKFLVIKGEAKFGFRHITSGEYIEIFIDGENAEVVETVPGWSHDITNVGEEELIVMLWANENFNPDAPDTVSYKV